MQNKKFMALNNSNPKNSTFRWYMANAANASEATITNATAWLRYNVEDAAGAEEDMKFGVAVPAGSPNPAAEEEDDDDADIGTSPKRGKKSGSYML
jgi:hypothetical protein